MSEQTPLNELSVKDLQAKLVELGMPTEDAEAFKQKAPAVATINAMAAAQAVAKEATEAIAAAQPKTDVEKVASIEEKVNLKEEKQTNKKWKSKAEAMKAHLLAQEFVSIIVNLEPKERAGNVVWVVSKTGKVIPDEIWLDLPLEEKMLTHQIHVGGMKQGGAIFTPQLNGYKYFIPKGKYYKVPKQIAEVVTGSQQQIMDAGEEIKLDRIDLETGRPIAESF